MVIVTAVSVFARNVTSAPALLAVAARAPMGGDLMTSPLPTGCISTVTRLRSTRAASKAGSVRSETRVARAPAAVVTVTSAMRIYPSSSVRKDSVELVELSARGGLDVLLLRHLPHVFPGQRSRASLGDDHLTGCRALRGRLRLRGFGQPRLVLERLLDELLDGKRIPRLWVNRLVSVRGQHVKACLLIQPHPSLQEDRDILGVVCPPSMPHEFLSDLALSQRFQRLAEPAKLLFVVLSHLLERCVVIRLSDDLALVSL